MEWFLGIIAMIVSFVAGFIPSFGEELRYRMPLPSWIPRAEATVLFGGDMMFDRSVRAHMQEFGEDHVFSCLGGTLQSPDLTVANLEGPITENLSKSVGSAVGDINNTKFTFASTTAQLLKRQGIDVVSLANNHAQDFGPSGVRATMQFLDAAGVAHFGDPFQESEYRTRVHGIPLSFIGYNQFQDFDGSRWHASTSTTEQVRAARSAGYMPIVFAHWGQEYVEAGASAKELARAWIDAGAEIVIGAHPHVVQEHEEYLPAGQAGAGKHIYYSLGNLIFDQYFSEDVRNGLLVEVTFDQKGVQGVREIPTRLERDRTTCLME